MAISPVQTTSPSNVPDHLQGMDFHTMMMALVFDRAETLDAVIKGQMGDMASRNEEIKKLNSALNEVRSKAPEKDEKNKEFTSNLSQETKDTLAKYGLDTLMKTEDGKMKLTADGSYEKMVENIKTQIDSLSQDSQLDMIKLQGLIQKHNQTIEMGSNEIAKNGQTAGTVISNMAR